jgi:hypothetical protein
VEVRADVSVAVGDPLRGQASYRRLFFLVAGLVLVAALSARLAHELNRLLFEADGPIDLLLLRRMIRDWLAGASPYEGRGGIHPPAVFVLLWPLYGWGSDTLTRWVYALVSFIVIAGFARVLLREARPESAWESALLAIVLAGCYPAAVTIGNGQITFFLLFAAIGSVLVFLRRPSGAGRDTLLTGLFLISLVKPPLTMPFFWVIAFSKGWLRPVVLALVAYVAATGISIALNGTPLEGLSAMLRSWYDRAEFGMAQTGYGNIHGWLGSRDLDAWILPASGLVFAVHGVWASRHRDADLWVLLGVAAIVARIWAYHQVYDDLLLVVPLIALYRLGRGETPDRTAWALFVVGAAVLVAPVTPILRHASWALVLLWLLQLAYLMFRARPVPLGIPEPVAPGGFVSPT